MTRPVVFITALGVVLAAATACQSRGGDHERREGHEAREHARRAPTVAIDRGRAIYQTNCAPCHGQSGKGDGPAAGGFNPAPRDHTDAAYMSKLTDTDIAQTIQYGGALKGKPMMPPSPQIKGDELASLVAYVRTLSAPARAGAGAGQ